MSDFLNIFMLVIEWLKTHYVPFAVGGFSVQISFFEIMISVCVIDIGINFLRKIFDY